LKDAGQSEVWRNDYNQYRPIVPESADTDGIYRTAYYVRTSKQSPVGTFIDLMIFAAKGNDQAVSEKSSIS
jgi:hypothetical protein